MNIFKYIKSEIISVVHFLYNNSSQFEDIFAVEKPKQQNHGDIATNIAMILAKPLKKNPREIATNIVDELTKKEFIKHCEVAGPGFINITVNDSLWQKLIDEVILLGNKYGNSVIGEQKKVNVEFVSTNPTGPMHIGHARIAIVGDVIAKVLKKCDYDVTKEYYINDAGGQIDILADSCFARYKEAMGQEYITPEGGYPGNYLIPVGQELCQQYNSKLLDLSKSERDAIIKKFAVTEMMKLIKSDLSLLDVHHDVFFSEKENLHETNKLDSAINSVSDKGYIYNGVLEPPKGNKPDDWEPREQALFKATEFGDDVDRPIQKSNGEYTYFAADIAYHKDKIERGFDNMILCLGADHAGYIKRMKAIVAALSNTANIDIPLTRLVNLLKDGRPYKMSKRAGNFVTVQDILSEVDKDILRFVMLSKSRDTVIDLDFTKVKEQNKDNPVFYVQYAHARGCSVLNNALSDNITFNDGNVSMLTSAQEKTVLKMIAYFPQIIEAAANTHEPHKIVYFLYELATNFHSLWSLGTEKPELRFITSDKITTQARLKLVKAVITTIKSGLDVLGIQAVEKM